MNYIDKGSEWRKWDLHFHTNASYDYKNKSITNQDIIDGLLNNGISAVAITDHHFIDVAKIKELQLLAKDKITIFPAIEFCSELGGSDSIHFIGIFSEKSNIEDIWIKIQGKFQLTVSDITNRGGYENIQCDLIDTCDYIHKLGGVTSIHAGSKSNTVEGIKNKMMNKMEQKRKILSNYIDILELGKESDSNDYEKKVFPDIDFKLPMIICSDNHDIKNYDLKQNCWIKADLTFEGLKQIIYEPEERVKRQQNKPEDKAGYQVIDKIIVLPNPDIQNSEIVLNQNLCSIIGGRSTGKSVLLAAMASKLKNIRTVNFSGKISYEGFIKKISLPMKVFWKDGEENNDREIEFFQQGYMNNLARNSKDLNELIQDILKGNGKDETLSEYNLWVTQNKLSISNSVSDLFKVLKSISNKKNLVRDKGDKIGIEREIQRIQDEFKRKNTISISEEENQQYDDIKKRISSAEQEIKAISNDINNIVSLKTTIIFKDSIAYELTPLSQTRKQHLESVFEELKMKFNNEWANILDLEVQNMFLAKQKHEDKIKQLCAKDIYLKVKSFYVENKQLQEYQEKLNAEKAKLEEINKLLIEIKDLEAQYIRLKEKIENNHKAFYVKTCELCPNLSVSAGILLIEAKFCFNELKYTNILENAISQRSYENQQRVQFYWSDESHYYNHILGLFDDLVNDKIVLKGSTNNQLLASSLLSECFFDIDYNIKYENDDFEQMSDGKKSFVVLNLLLEFSKKKCPILIDQPEDDLDNRAIYNELVSYLKKKKQERQIIVVTHNSNIVVGGDSEQVIVANQCGVNSINRDSMKFQYISGSLENSKPKDNSNVIVLESQGIREHVCEILEGGRVAFKKREEKYGFK